MNEMNFHKKNVIITGGSSGIGKATARLLAGQGANVFIIARDPQKMQQAVSGIRTEMMVDLGQQFDWFRADVRNWGHVEETIGIICDRFGSPDILINSAGICHCQYFGEIPVSFFSNEIETNYLGTLYTTRAVLPFMKRHGIGHIVNISSVAGFVGGFGYGSYSPTKFAVWGFSEVLRSELKPDNISVSLLVPFDTQTPMLAEENRTKPPETKIISGAVKPDSIATFKEAVAWQIVRLFTSPPMTPEQVAVALLKGIEKKKFLIIPDPGMRILYYLKGPLTPLLNWVFDTMVMLARRQRRVSQVGEIVTA